MTTEDLKTVSINHEATITKPDGTTASAKEILCAELPAAELAIAAGIALSKNFFMKALFSMVLSGLKTMGEAFCATP